MVGRVDTPNDIVTTEPQHPISSLIEAHEPRNISVTMYVDSAHEQATLTPGLVKVAAQILAAQLSAAGNKAKSEQLQALANEMQKRMDLAKRAGRRRFRGRRRRATKELHIRI